MEELSLLVEIADAVEQIVHTTANEEFGEPGGMGADGLPAARIDRLAEERIIEIAEQAPLDLNIVSEEAGRLDRGADRTLIVDPIDGTTNAVRGIPFYCVSLAIAGDGLEDLEAGLVRNLATGDTYHALRGQGAYLNGEPIRTRPWDPETAVRSRIARTDELGELGPLVDGAPYVRRLGAAALEMSLVAQGAMDAFFHLSGGLRVMDIAAGTLIVEEAGGSVVTPDGRPPEMPFDPLARTSLVAVGDPQLLQRAGVVA